MPIWSRPPPPESLLFRHRQLAPTASVRVSPICLGTMNFGEHDKTYLGECSKDTAFEILDTFKSLGGNFIDTAVAYQGGDSETWIGEWLRSRNCRDQMIIATKYTGPYQTKYKATMIQSNFGGNGSKSLRLSVEKSLERLQTTYVDILYVHWWDFTATISEVMHSLNDLVVAGKALYLGISDTPAWIVAKANQYARDHGLRQFVVYQGMWNAAWRDVERDVVPMCRDEGMAMLAYGSLGQGRFQTKDGFKEREDNNTGRKGMPSETEKAVSAALQGIAEAKNAAITSVAMAYIMQKAPYVFPLIGGRKLDHLKSNLDALRIVLSREDVAKIEAAMYFNPGFPHTFLTGTLLGQQDDTQHTVLEGPNDVWLTYLQGTFDFVEPQKAIKPFVKQD
ncbi:Aldo keto reductase protein [Rutstroemia sp. NJR-2017a BVV2]|nr:Aldo keto reductase protein [Rutstroemia sp. NJR-2017a BVV2]